MEISINAEHFCDRRNGTKRTLESVLEQVKNAGFNNIDFITDINSANQTAELLQKLGLKVNQSHCPFNRYSQKDYSEFSKDIINAVESARILGSDIFVVHADEFDFSNEEFSDKAVVEFNYKLYYPVLERINKYGMKLALENVFQDVIPNPRFSSTPEQLMMLLERFNDKNVGICLDTGHAKVADDENYLSNIRLYSKHIISTHIHEAFYGHDLHLFPFLGGVELDKCVEILKESNYSGMFTYEFVYDRIPDEFLQDVLNLLYKMGEYLANSEN